MSIVKNRLSHKKKNKMSKHKDKSKYRRKVIRTRKLIGKRTKRKVGGFNSNRKDSFIDNLLNYKGIQKKNYYELPKGVKIFTFADIHGDLSLLISLLKLSGVMNEGENPDGTPNELPTPDSEGIRDLDKMTQYFKMIKWTGGKNKVVQIGDQTDRSRDPVSHSAYKDEGSIFEIMYMLLLLDDL